MNISVSIEPGSSVIAPSPERIQRFEEAYDLNLADSYKTLLRHGNGGKPTNRYLALGNKQIEISFFLPIVDRNVDLGDLAGWTVGAVDARFGELLAEDPDKPGMQLVPFAHVVGDCLLCFDCRSVRENPPVVFWDISKARPYEPNPIPVAASFSDFLKLLQ